MKIKGFIYRNILLYISMFLITVLIIGYANYISSTKVITEQATYTNISLLKQINENVDIALRAVDIEIFNFMKQNEVSKYMDYSYENDEDRFRQLTELQNQISVMRNKDRNIDSVYIYSKGNSSILSEFDYQKAADFYDVKWLDDFNNLDSFYKYLDTRKIGSSVNEKNVITLIRVYPTTTKKEEIKGAIIVNIDENVLSRVIARKESNSLINIFAVSNDKTVLFHEDKYQIYANYSDKTYIDDVFKNDYGFTIKSVDNKSTFVFYCTSSYTGWKYIGIIPESGMTTSSDKVRNTLVLIGIILFIAVLLYAIIISDRTFRPIGGFFDSVKGSVENSNYYKENSEEIGTIEDVSNAVHSIIKSNEELENRLETYAPAMKWRIIMDILMSDPQNDDDFETSLSSINISFYHGNFIVLIAEIENKSDENSANISRLTECFETVVNQDYKGASIELYDDKAAVIISFPGTDEAKNASAALTVAEFIREFSVQELGIYISIGVGSIVSEINEVRHSYYEALKALQYKIVMGKNSVISIEDINPSGERELYRTILISSRLPEYIRNNDIQKINEQIDTVFLGAINKKLSPEMLFQLGMYIIIQGVKALEDYEIKQNIDMGNDSDNIYKNLSLCETIDQMKHFIKKTLNKFSEEIDRAKELRSAGKLNNELVNNVLQFIKENYTKYDLSLSYIAEKFHISVPYLSKIFKVTMDTNFIDYLIILRIEKAKEYLSNSNIKVNEISEKVGYNNFSSFARIFKKYTGMTPSEFRSINNQ